MKEMVKIRYHSVIKHDQDKVSDLKEVVAEHEKTFLNEAWTFQHPTHGTMRIVVQGNQVHLSHGRSQMDLILYEKRKILYQVAYGVIEIEAVLKKLERQNQRFAIVYYLYDQTEILSRCYLTIEAINPVSS